MAAPCLPHKAPLDGHLSPRLHSVTPSYGAISHPCSASPPAQGPNALGFVVVALSDTLASSTLAVTLAGAGTVSMALHTPQQGAITLVVIRIHVQQPVRLTCTLSHLFTWARYALDPLALGWDTAFPFC